ncbi:MAG: glycosyltransferase family 1 protein [Chloroflexota bacterium]
MRILHVVQRYWPGVGGAEKHLQEISERLVRDGHEVTVYTTDAGDFQYLWDGRKTSLETLEEVHNGVTIRRFRLRHFPLSYRTFPAMRRALVMLSDLASLWPDALGERMEGVWVNLLFRLAHYMPWVPDLARALQEARGQFDVVAGMTIHYESLLQPAWHHARREGIPFLLYPLIHLGESERSSLRRYHTMRHQLALARASDVIFAQTGLERDFWIRQGVAPERIVIGGVGINPWELAGGDAARARARFGLARPIVLALGAAAYDKGTFHTVEAMRRLWAQGVEADLVIAGAVTDGFARWLRASERGQSDPRLRVLGSVSDTEKCDLLAAASVLALPSRTDSFGIVFLEAWLYGLPVVGAAAGGIPDVIVDGQDGYVVPFGDAEALADRLARLLANPDLAQRMGEAGRRKVLAQHTWDHVYARVRPSYERACERRSNSV